MNQVIKIGCFSAFWGDTSTAAHQLVRTDGLNYLVGDYLSEVTMGILARFKEEKKVSSGMGAGGYVKEFVERVCKNLLPTFSKKNIKVITNAGGMNPLACKSALEKLVKDMNLNLKIAAVYGDDLTDSFHDLETKIIPFEMENEFEELPKKKLISANAYLGATPIVKALQSGADIIVTGRCVDSALVLAPLMYEFKWKEDDYDLLAAGSVAGHVIECGCQCTGGNFTDWELSYQNGWDNVGFPIIECFKDGSFIVTKPDFTGGIVNRGTVAEQLLYEIHDPSNYILPDVIVDFTNLVIEELEKSKHGTGRVLVKGARGRPPSEHYKVSLTYLGAMQLSAELMIGGIDARRKALAVADGILSKTKKMFKLLGMKDFMQTNVETLGAEHTYGRNSRLLHSREVILRISVVHENPKALMIFASELAPAATGMAPGITGSGSGRPKPRPIIHFHSCLIPKKEVPIQISVGNENYAMVCNAHPFTFHNFHSINHQETHSLNQNDEYQLPNDSLFTYVPLITLCYGRSGDKGDFANIGIIARKKEYYPYLKKHLTAEVVYNHLSHLIKGKVVRYELPGFYGLNFVCSKALGGGGLSSLNIDRQGKAYAQQLLDYQILVPISWVRNVKSKL